MLPFQKTVGSVLCLAVGRSRARDATRQENPKELYLSDIFFPPPFTLCTVAQYRGSKLIRNSAHIHVRVRIYEYRISRRRK